MLKNYLDINKYKATLFKIKLDNYYIILQMNVLTSLFFNSISFTHNQTRGDFTLHYLSSLMNRRNNLHVKSRLYYIITAIMKRNYNSYHKMQIIIITP